MRQIITQRKNGSRRVQIIIEGPSKTEQSHRKECNINTIIKKTLKTGLFPSRADQPMYGNFATDEDFHSTQDRMIEARADFMSLPSDIRTRFNNDPGLLISFINDPENEAEAIELGLLPVKPGQAEEIQPEPGSEPETAPAKAAEPVKVEPKDSSPT